MPHQKPARPTSPNTYPAYCPRTLFLDTETTGLRASDHRVVELTILDHDGTALIDTLINPGMPIPPDATRVHGITDAMVRNAPTLDELWPKVESVVRDSRIVIYNAKFDTAFLPGLAPNATGIVCAMKAYTDYRLRVHGERPTWRKLIEAAAYVGYDWEHGHAHRARGDAEACRRVWLWLIENGRPSEPRITCSPTESLFENPTLNHKLSGPIFKAFLERLRRWLS